MPGKILKQDILGQESVDWFRMAQKHMVNCRSTHTGWGTDKENGEDNGMDPVGRKKGDVIEIKQHTENGT